MEIRVPAGKLGNMCPHCISGGGDGSLKLQICVDVTVSPLGMMATRGLVAIRLFMCGFASLP